MLATGASSGIGRKITERLASQGFFVYAGARAQKDLDELNAIKNVQALRLDVTVASDIAAAVATVTKAGRGLHSVVNNAGVVVVAPLIEADEKDLDFIFNVNMAAIPIRKLIDEIVQLNEGQKFTYDRDVLVKMLDDALARAKQKR